MSSSGRTRNAWQGIGGQRLFDDDTALIVGPAASAGIAVVDLGALRAGASSRSRRSSMVATQAAVL